MVSKKIMLSAFLGMAGIVATPAADAGTVGLWLFDDVVDVTPPAGDPPIDPAGGETFYDETPNALDFVATTNFGTFTPTVDRPAVITTGTALISAAGGSSLPSTPNSTLLDRQTGSGFTVEFWLKYTDPEDFAYIMSFDAVPGGDRSNEWGIYNNGGQAGNLSFFVYENGGGPYPEVTTGLLGSDWNHIAFTVDNSDNSMKSYINGSLVGSNTAPSLFGSPVSGLVKWGRSHSDGFAAHTFVIDELRISDEALLPGNGTGVGELAWNATLVPEPATASLLALAGAALIKRARRQ